MCVCVRVYKQTHTHTIAVDFGVHVKRFNQPSGAASLGLSLVIVLEVTSTAQTNKPRQVEH